METLTGFLALIDWRGILIIAMIFIPLEHIFALHEEQKTLRKGWMNDVFYLLFNGLPVKIGFLVLLAVVMTGAEGWMPAGVHTFVQDLPLWVQVPSVILIADVGFYIAHRTFHSVPFLWRFHAVHHSVEEMDWLAAHRVHPVDQIATMSASLLPVYVLGFEPAAIGIYAVIYHWQALLIHSNIKINFGPLRWLIASPQFHHWHHANERQAWDKNFSGQLPIIDAVLGTLYLPDRMPKVYGCDDPVPELYHQQMLYPLMPKEHTGKAAASPSVANPLPETP